MAFDPKQHVIHTAGGRLGRGPLTTAAGVQRIVDAALAANAAAGIVLNFHGGLVSAAGALRSARQRLYPLYAGRAGAYPIFFVWESGFLEAPLNNLAEIGRESLFRAFILKVGDWVLRQRSAGPALRAARPSPRAPPEQTRQRFHRALNRWFASGARGRALPPALRDFPPQRPPRAAARRARLARDLETLAREIETDLAADHRFRAALAAQHAAPARRGRQALRDRRALPATAALRPAALAVARIVWQVLRREASDRDHGFYLTLVEEVLRELYVGRIGRSLWWDRMKSDTADAFKPGNAYGGTVFLAALQRALAGRAAPRITLIGHSTGAIYIGHFLRAAAHWLPELRFDVILEAPAATHDFFARMIAEHGSRIRALRLFGMSEARELADTLVPVLYPASLLYFVSGLLEDEADQPVLGMQRYLARPRTFTPARFPGIATCRRFLAGFDHALAWSPQRAPPGCVTDGRHHQDFDDVDTDTLASIEHILKFGY